MYYKVARSANNEKGENKMADGETIVILCTRKYGVRNAPSTVYITLA